MSSDLVNEFVLKLKSPLPESRLNTRLGLSTSVIYISISPQSQFQSDLNLSLIRILISPLVLLESSCSSCTSIIARVMHYAASWFRHFDTIYQCHEWYVIVNVSCAFTWHRVI